METRSVKKQRDKAVSGDLKKLNVYVRS